MMWVVMYWPVQSWMVSLIGSFDSTAAAAPAPASPVATSAAATSFLTDVFIGFTPSCPETGIGIMHKVSRPRMHEQPATRTISRDGSGPGQVGLAQRSPTWNIAGRRKRGLDVGLRLRLTRPTA